MNAACLHSGSCWAIPVLGLRVPPLGGPAAGVSASSYSAWARAARICAADTVFPNEGPGREGAFHRPRHGEPQSFLFSRDGKSSTQKASSKSKWIKVHNSETRSCKSVAFAGWSSSQRPSSVLAGRGCNCPRSGWSMLVSMKTRGCRVDGDHGNGPEGTRGFVFRGSRWARESFSTAVRGPRAHNSQPAEIFTPRQLTLPSTKEWGRLSPQKSAPGVPLGRPAFLPHERPSHHPALSFPTQTLVTRDEHTWVHDTDSSRSFCLRLVHLDVRRRKNAHPRWSDVKETLVSGAHGGGKHLLHLEKMFIELLCSAWSGASSNLGFFQKMLSWVQWWKYSCVHLVTYPHVTLTDSWH